jgi:uncharacterized protein with PIN domain
MRFLLDGMLGKLARWLRMIGYEATYMNDSPDQDLLSLAKRESFILLTSDEELYRNAISKGIDSFLVQGRTESERLAGLAERYDLNLRIDTVNSRCPICGTSIREVPKRDVEALVPPTTFKVYQSFWLCTNAKCAKVYWQGSHWKRIEQTLESARKILDRKRAAQRSVAGGASEPRRRKNTSSVSAAGDQELSANEGDH